MIIALEEAKRKLNDMQEDLVELGSALRIEVLKERIEELEAASLEPNFWNDAAKSTRVMQEIKQMKDTVERYETLCARAEDAMMLAEMAIEENDDASLPEVEAELAFVIEEEERMRISVLLSGPYDKHNAILSFHPGAGGTEAQDWASMLYRMYTRWGDAHGFNVKLVDFLDGDEAGLKSATIIIEGTNAYGYLKSENGVHRLVRVSPFDASGRRQTSFASVEVLPEFDDEDDKTIEIPAEDLEITAHRSSGAGGQHINKTDSAIRITHLPTGTVVECQDERSQHKNKERALKILSARLLEVEQQKHKDEIDSARRAQVGTGDRSERIRTYNFPQGRVSDHRIGLTLYKIDAIMNGNLDELIDALITADTAAKLEAAGEGE